jgi:catalase
MTASASMSPSDPLITQLIDALDQVFGLHPGFRPVHAKGIMASGTFTPGPDAAKLTRAPHATRASTPVVVRLSDFAGVPVVPDNDPNGAGPRGMAIRFNLAEHVHTDIVGHSHDGFPVRTGEEFVEFARALAASGPSVPKPWPIEKFLGAHPKALRFVEAPKPIPTSFARESFFGVNAYRFTNSQGVSKFGRYRILPELGHEHVPADELAAKSVNFLVDEFPLRLMDGPVKYRIVVQVAAPEDEVNDSTVNWPNNRPEVDFGTVTLTHAVDHLAPDMRKIIFDPIPRVDGIDPSADPLIEVRAALYLRSGRRRRAATAN